MNKFVKYASIVAVLVFVVSVLLLPGSKAQQNDNPSNQTGESTIPAEKPGDIQGESPSDEIILPLNGQSQAESGTVTVLVELTDAPLTKIYGLIMAKPGLSKEQKQAEAGLATKSQFALIVDEQATIASRLKSSRFKAREIYRVQRAVNGIAVEVDADKIEEIRRMPGVKSVTVIEPEYPTNSTSVPFLGTPLVWGSSLNIGMNGLGVRGENIKLGIIDTGVDYQHAIFGGTGLLADYQANNRAIAPDAYFPTAKVVGGYDFAGDAYTGGNTPVPDNDPMDCNGHGTHVAGTAGGYGVNADGTTYTGAFNETANFNPLRIGPGTAPKSDLYALRVFGCSGSTNLTVQAIDWATDPNNDNDLSDHLDVINMSLGSRFGTISSSSAIASDNAVLAGVIVVTSAGNDGDTYFISGAPGSGSRVLATAASVDSGQPGPGVRVNAPAGIAGNYVAGTAGFGPPPPPGGLTGDVVIGLDPSDAAGPLTTDGCSPLTNASAVAGKIALIDRGTCGFSVKVKNAQDAGAVGAIIANSSAGAFGNMGGTDPTITIPSVLVTFADGNTFKANIPGLNVTLFNGADTLASFSSRGPRGGGFSPVSLKPDIAAPGLNITSAQTGVTGINTYNAGNQPLTISGTSMASPHMAGIMALLRQLHPDWTVEQLKALAMNGAIRDLTTLPGGGGLRYGPGRIGAGRTDPVVSALLPVIAYNAEEAGVVSVTFSNSEVVGSQTQTKKIRVVNYGTTSQSFNLGIDTVVDAPGVSYSLPGGTNITVPPGETVEFDVQMNADASQMDHTRDLTVATTQTVATPASLANLAIPRHWVTEEGGYVTFSQGGNLKMRVPVYATPQPKSDMSAPATIATGGAPTGSTTIPLSGTDVCTGTRGAGPTCTGSFPTDEVSLVSPFELQVVSPRNPSLNGANDLQYAGVATDGSRIWFGVSTWEEWRTPTENSFSIYVDNNLDGTYDRVIINSNTGALSRIFFGGTGVADTDAFVTSVITPPSSFSNTVAAGTPNYVNRLSAAQVDSSLYNNNVMFMGATPAQLGLANANAPFRYKIETCPGSAPACQTFNGFRLDEAAGPYNWSGGAQGLNFGGATLAEDLNGDTLPVTWNTANMTANGSLGALLLHHHNGNGKRAEVVLLQGSPSADLALSYSFSPASPTVGQNVTLTLTATNNGPNAASGVVVSNPLPAGLTYVSDDSGGAYNSANGQWSVGALGVSESKTVNIVATVNTSDQIRTRAQITAGTPLDTNPANNQATLTIMAPRQADLGLTMNVSSPTVNVGGSVTYTLTVTNKGEDPAYSINVTENFPSFPSLNPSSFTVSQGSYDPSTGVWNLASLGKGFSATLTLTVTAPNTAGPLKLEASVASDTSDPDTSNNSASATTTVLSPANVSGTKTVSGAPYYVNGQVTYTVTLSNSSSFDQQNNPGDEFTDTLPAGLTLVSATATSGTAVANVGTNTVTFNGSIPANGSVTITITATIKSGTGGQTISNQGTINYDADGNGTNETSTVTDDPSVSGTANPTVFTVSFDDLALSMFVSPDPVAPGGTSTYQMILTNNSNATAQNIVLSQSDSFPRRGSTRLEIVSMTAPSGFTCRTANPITDPSFAEVVCRGSLGARQQAQFTIVKRQRTPLAKGTVINHEAEASSGAFEANTSNNRATDTTTVQ